jgi:hypothetical protein
LLLQPEPKNRPEAARISILPLNELKMENYKDKFLQNGYYYEGQFKDEKRHGFGALSNALDIRLYEGQFVNNMK